MSAESATSGDGLPRDIFDALGESEAYFNTLLQAEKTCREVFFPPLEGILNPSPFEAILIAQAQRVFRLLQSAAELPHMVHMPVHFAAVRTCFEIAVEIELLTRAGQILPQSPAPEDEVVKRHTALMRRMAVKQMYVLGKSRDPQKNAYGRAALERCERSAEEKEREVFGDVNVARGHWWRENFSERVKWLHNELSGLSPFHEWHEHEYRLASQYVHGPLSLFSICDSTPQGLRGAAAVIYPWLPDFAGPHIFEPIWRRLRLHESHPDSWRVIRSMADNTNGIFAHALKQGGRV